MIRKTSVTVLLLITLMSISSCCNEHNEHNNKNHENNLLMATFYNYYAAEYKALAYQAFNIGKLRLKEIRNNNPENMKLAIVVDIDETILDNSPYEAKMMLNESGYSSESWIEWCNLENAQSVPGAVEFLNYADSMGFNIFYITNRKKKFVEKSTIENVRKMGFPQVIEDRFLLRDGERNKESRRQAVSENYEIVLLAGDNLGDLYEDSGIFSDREKLMESNKDHFGSKFIVLPNAMYGEWVSSIGLLAGDEQTIDSLLKAMADNYKRH